MSISERDKPAIVGLAKIKSDSGDVVDKRRELVKALDEDPEIANPTDIGVTFKKRLFGSKMKVELFGKVTTLMEKARAYEITRNLVKDTFPIVNHLKIVERVGVVKNKTPDDER